MYTPSEGQQRSSARSRAGTITFYTLLCFSLAGLIMGFAIGGFAAHLSRSSIASAGATTTSAPTLTGHGPNPVPTPTPENVFLGVPNVAASDYTSSETADGTTNYHLSAQIITKTDNTPITTTDVVCRLWLTDDAQATTEGLSANNYTIPRNPTTFNQPFPQEVNGALNFASASQQTQSCAVNGKTNWTYTLANGVPHGPYYLVVMADWKGIHYNWYMLAITVNDGSNGSNNGG